MVIFTGFILSIRLASAALTKEMVNLESARRLGPSLLNAGRQWFTTSTKQLLQHAPSSSSSSSERADSSLHQASTEYLVHHWLEALFAWFQVIVLWHEPLVSLCAISGLLSSFLLLTHFAPRFYATIMIAIFVYNLTKVWFRHVWPEIRVPPESEEAQRLDVDRFTYLHPQLMTLAELGQVLENLMILSEHYIGKLILLRQEKPVKFCLIICSTLSCTAYIGNRVSGCKLLFLFATLLLTGPAVYLHLLPQSLKDYLRRKVANRILKPVVIDESEQQNDIELESSQKLRQKSSAPLEISQPQSLQSQQASSPPSPSSSSPKSSSSTSSMSVIESEDEQHDGFVLL